MAYETYAQGGRFGGAYTHSAEGYLLPGPPGAVYTGAGGSPTSPVSSVTTASSSSASPPADRERDHRGHMLGGISRDGHGGGGAIFNVDANASQHAHRQYHHHQHHDRQIVRQQYYGEFETEYQQEYSQTVLIHPQNLPYAHAHAHAHGDAYGAEKQHQHQQQHEGPDTAGGGADTEFPPMHTHMHDASPLMFASPGESAILEYGADVDMEMERSVGVMGEYVPGGVTHDAYVFESYPAAGMSASPEP